MAATKAVCHLMAVRCTTVVGPGQHYHSVASSGGHGKHSAGNAGDPPNSFLTLSASPVVGH